MKAKLATIRALHGLLALALGAGTAQAVGTPQTKANTTTLNLGADWVSGTTPTSADTATWQSSPVTLAKNVTLTLGGNVLCFNFDMRTSTGTPPGTGLVIGNDGLGSVLNLYSNVTTNNQCALDQGNGALSTVINCPIAIYNNTAFRISNGGDMSVGGSIGESGGSKSLTFNGNGGWLNLSGANTYSGGTIMGSGAGNLLTVSGSGTLGAAGSALTLPTATTSGVFLDLGGTTQTLGAVNLGQACLIQNGSINATNFNVGTSAYGVFNVNLGGTSALTLNNSGKLSILSGTNTWSGATTVTAGTLLATQPAALPTSGTTGTITVSGTAGVLALRAGAATGEWAATDVSALLANANFTFSAAGALGIDTSGGDFSYDTAIPSKTNNGLTKLGPNTLTLSAANLYPGKTTINRGGIKVDSATGSLASTSALTFSGTGLLNFDNTGGGGSTAQALGALTFSAGEGTLLTTRSANQNQAVTLASWTRTSGATGNFVNGGDGSGNGASNGFNFTTRAAGFIDQGTFYGGSSYAWMDGANTFVRAINYASDAGATSSGAATTLGAATHQQITGAVSAQTSATFTTLNISGGNNITLADASQVLTTNGILKSGNNSATISGGGIKAASAAELVIRTDGANDALTISSVIAPGPALRSGATTNGSAVVTGLSQTSDLVVGMNVSYGYTGGYATSTIKSIDTATGITLNSNSSYTGTPSMWFGYTNNRVTKSGAGTLTLSGANLFGGGFSLNAGRLNIANSMALGGAGNGAISGAVTINEGTTIDNTSGGTLVMACKYPMTWNGNFTFVGTNDLALIDPTGNGNITMPNDVTVTVSTAGSTLKSASNFGLTTAKLTKSGPGTLFIGSNGGFGVNGGLVINEGVFAGTATGGQADGTFSGPVSLGDTTPGNSHGAILDMAVGQFHGAPITARAGTSGILAILGEGSPTLYGPMVLNNALTLSAPSGTLSHYGVISGGSNLIIGNTGTFVVYGITKSLTHAGTVKLYNRNTYSGNTVVNSGTLALGALGTIDSSPIVSIAAGATFDVSAVPTPYTLGGSSALSAKGTGTAAGTYARIVGPSGGVVSLGAQPISLTFTPTSASGDTTHPSLLVSQGSLTLNNNTFTVNNAGPALGVGIYRLIQVTNATVNQNGSPSYPVTVTGNGLTTHSVATISVSSGNVILSVITQSVTSFSGLTLSQTIQQGTGSVTLGGTISAAGSLYPADGETIHVTINGVTQDTTTSGGTFSVSFPIATLVGSATPYTITYGYPGDATLTSATDASTGLTITNQTVPTISTWPSATSITYGENLASSTIHSDGSASVPGTFTFTTLSTTPTGAGSYAASGTFTPSNPALYSTVVVPGAVILTVNQKELTLSSAAVAPKAYNGNSAATITGTLNGVLPSDAGLVTLVGSGSFDNGGAISSGISVTPSCTLGGTKAADYYLTLPGGLSGDVTQAILTVKANSVGRPAGVENPAFTYTVSGYQNGDNASTVGLSGVPDLYTTADASSPEGSYPITCTPGSMTISSSNYALAFVDGVLQVLSARTWAKGNGIWDVQTSVNWTSASGPATYVDGGEVLFPDPTGFGFGPFTVTLNTNVNPYSVTVNNPTKDYTLSGTGAISGTAGVTKSGAGVLTLAAANTYSGGTLVNSGSLSVANQNALGSGALTLAAGATLQQTVFEGNSAGGALPNAVVLSGGNATMNINFGAAKDLWFTQSVSGPGGMIVQSGDGIRAVTLTGAKTFEGGVTLKDGNRLQINNVGSLGSGTFSLGNATGGTLVLLANLAGSPLPNTVDLASGGTLKVDTTSGGLNFAGTIENTGSLTKTGSNPLILSGTNTYSGSTKIVSGTIQISADANLGASTLVGGGGFIDAGANSLSLNQKMTGSNVISVNAPGDVSVTGDLTEAGLAKAGSGTLTLGSGVTAHLADFLDATGTLNLSNPLAISHALYLGNVRLALSGGSSFSLSGANVLAPAAGSLNVITASSGTVTLTPPAAAATGGTIGTGTLTNASFDPGTGVASVTATAGGNPQTDDHVWQYITLPTGDFDLKVRVVTGASGWQRAGLMIRDSLAKAANYSAVWSTGGATCAATGITGTTGNTTYREDLAHAAWMRIKKVGLTVTSLYSSDGWLYNEAYTRTYAAWGATTYIGLDVNYGSFTATFDNISFLGSGTMPDWSTTNLAINTGAVMNLNYPGSTNIAELSFDGAVQALGTWGSSSSGATHQDDSRFVGPGTVTVTTALSDFDVWAAGYNLSGGRTGDDDGDGLSNFAEYAFGLNPESAASVNPITQPIDKSSGLFKYTRRATPATTGLTYSYEWTTTLNGDWQAFTPAVDSTSNNATPVEEVTVQVPAALLANPRLFLRVKAQ